MRPVPAVSALKATPTAQVPTGSPPHAVAIMQHPTPSVMNGAGRAAIDDMHICGTLVVGGTFSSPDVGWPLFHLLQVLVLSGMLVYDVVLPPHLVGIT